MTSEELAVAGIPPAGEDIQGIENTQLQESNPIPVAAPESENREEGEIRSEGEDIEDVDADPRELIAMKRSKSLPPSFVFGESKVTTNLINEYEAVGFFPASDGHAPLDEQIPTPEPMKSSCFATSSPAGLGFLVIPLCLRFWKNSP
jgi:hypothetical protein